MRIIAGANKGRALKAPTWAGLRPTSDKLRETLFNILAPRIENAHVLDCFSGSGAIALEALSRGAVMATCIDDDRRAIRLIEENRERCGEANRCVIIRGRVEHAVDGPLSGAPFDVIVLDPPYDFAPMEHALIGAATHRAPDAILVLEHATRVTPPQPAGLTIARTVRSGDSSLTFYR